MIEVFYRSCFYSPNQELANRNRPEWFSKARCSINMRNTTSWDLKGSVNLTTIYDEHFGKLTHPRGETIVINCGTEASSFLATLDIIMSRNLPDDTIVYIVEDDYLHREGWEQALREAFELPIDYGHGYIIGFAFRKTGIIADVIKVCKEFEHRLVVCCLK